jgi:hypothetical protein
MDAFSTWLKGFPERFTVGEIAYNLAMTLFLAGLGYLLQLAANNPPNLGLYALGAIPLSAIIVWSFGRAFPRRPVIVGRLEQGAFWSDNPATTAGMLMMAKVTNRGLPTSLDDWGIIARHGKDEYHLRTLRLTEAGRPYIMNIEDGRVIELLPQNALDRTIQGLARGQTMHGWIIGDTAEITQQILERCEFELQCVDAFDKRWTIAPVGRMTISRDFSVPAGMSARITQAPAITPAPGGSGPSGPTSSPPSTPRS